MSNPIDRATDSVAAQPYGPTSARRIRRLTGLVDAMSESVPAMQLVAALTDRTPARLLSYRRAISTLETVGTVRIGGEWQSLHGLW